MAVLFLAPGASRGGQHDPAPVGGDAAGTVTVSLDRPLSSFAPARALGAGVDGHGHGDTARIYTRPNVRAMRSAGYRPLTYRLRTELGVEAWHWNPVGSWSDPRQRQGYWTGSSRPSGRVAATYGYRLPRRGDTVDQANDNGYSRLDDGLGSTFWKSNPYLDPRYTGESEALHRQWALVDLGRDVPVDALRLDWAAPYARSLRAEYWTGRDPIQYATSPVGAWQAFPRASFHGHGGRQTLRLAARPVSVRFVRVLMTHSSHTALPGSHDVRDRLGFAVREIRVGTMRPGGGMSDAIRHLPSARQTVIYVSSTDPWHRASDIDRGTEQPSFQTVLRSGLTNGQSMLTPVPVLYGTPRDSANELRYLHALRLPVRRVEMGEEPDGQLAAPEDFGALYALFARALHRASPHAQLGGPGYQTSIPDWVFWPDAHGNRSWTNRFLGELRRRGSLAQLRFFSFEWYPFDNGCAPPAPQLASAPGLLADVLRRQRAEGLPPGLPKLITEYGYSAFATRQMVDMPGALLNADIVGGFLSLGGDTAYLYGYEPDALIEELPNCRTWGNLVLFLSNDARVIKQPVATYWESLLLNRSWTQPGSGRHTLLSTDSSARDAAGQQLVSAYSVRRPDGRVAVLLVNKDPRRTWRVRIDMRGGSAPRPAGAFRVDQLSSRDYVWHARGAHSSASPDRPPLSFTVPSSAGGVVSLPPWSVSVARTAGPVGR